MFSYEEYASQNIVILLLKVGGNGFETVIDSEKIKIKNTSITII